MEREIQDLLDGEAMLTLAVAWQDAPHAVCLYYVRQGEQLLWFSSPRSRHSLAIGGGASASVAVGRTGASWRDIRGLSARGRAAPVPEAGWADAVEAYSARFPFLRDGWTGEGFMLEGRLLRVRPYAFRAEEIRYTDNRQGIVTTGNP